MSRWAKLAPTENSTPCLWRCAAKSFVAPAASVRTSTADPAGHVAGPEWRGAGQAQQQERTTPGGPTRQLPDLELRHRRHARVEDRIRATKDTGLRNLPLHTTDQNRIRVAIATLAADLLAWCARLALPASAAGYEPKRMRLQILATAGRLVRTARRHVLHIDHTWPGAQTITTAHTRLRALPVP